jgi:hypothetical protein
MSGRQPRPESQRKGACWNPHEAVAAQIRDLVDRIIVPPRGSGGVEIELYGSMARVLAIATNNQIRERSPHRVL